MAKQNQARKRHANTIDEHDLMSLRKSGYDDKRDQFTTTFVLQHKRYPGKIAQIKAMTPVQACRFLHWKPKQVRILEVIEDDDSTKDVPVDAQAPQAMSIM